MKPYNELNTLQQNSFRVAMDQLAALARIDSPEESRQGLRGLLHIERERYDSIVTIPVDAKDINDEAFYNVLDCLQRIATKEDLDRFPAEFGRRPYSQIVPVGLIDVKLLDSSVHVPLQIAHELERVVRLMEGKGPTEDPQDLDRPVPWSPFAGNALPSRTCWNEFARTAALTWDSGLNERRQHLDLETYMVELKEESVLRAGGGIAEAFRQFVSQLVLDFQQWQRIPPAQKPLFVIAFENSRFGFGLELYRTMRHMLHHPRVAYLLVGSN
jgi:hypothetical protein